MLRVVADLGNSRLKWARLDAAGRLAESVALPIDNPAAWDAAWRVWDPAGDSPSAWAVASVNPPTAAVLARFLDARPVPPTRTAWYRSAADVPVRHRLEHPETAGADRALAVAAALAERPAKRPRLVVLCGTAVTVERVADDGVWEGGAIAAGLSLTARALHLLTAQLPRVEPRDAPPAWGNATRLAREAGVFWGVVGALRELLTRQAAGFDGPLPPWVVWTGGDAATLSRAVAWPNSRVAPDLVLQGLAGVAFGATGG